MKISNINLANFRANVHYQLFKRGITFKMLCWMFGVGEEEMNNILSGKRKDEKAKSIVRDIIKYF